MLIPLDIMDHCIILYDNGMLRRRFQSLRRRLAELDTRKVILKDSSRCWHLRPYWKPGEAMEL